MAITKVQQVTGSGATLVLNGVTAGNTLTLQDSYYRSGGSQTAEPVPTDSQGTWSVLSSGTPGVTATDSCGCGIFYQANVAAGTHTVTPQANGSHNATLIEWSGLTTTPADVAASAKTDAATFTSQVTGTTAATAQADELVLIALGLGATIGSTNVGFTDPVTGFTTLQVVPNDSTDVATFHAYKIVSATGTQSATFNWTDNEINQLAGAAIGTLKAAAGSGGGSATIAWRKA